MKLKTNLHFHSKEDPLDIIKYDLFEGIDKMHKLGFKVLASTCHTKNVCTQEHIKYAKEKGITLIPGIEANIYEKGASKKSHILILNCDTTANNIKTFDDLSEYKKNNPNILIIAPHPFFYGNYSLGNLLEKYINLFDAIEISWFYTKLFNRNKKAYMVAKKYNKPIIATSDTHHARYFNINFATLNSEKNNINDIFTAIKKQSFTNTTSERPLFEIFVIFAMLEVKMEILKINRKIKKLLATNTPRVRLIPKYIFSTITLPFRQKALQEKTQNTNSANS